METNEVMLNEEAIEAATEEIVKAGSGCGFKVLAGFGVGILTGVVIPKLVKLAMARIEAQWKQWNLKHHIVDVEAEVHDFEGSNEEFAKE